MILPYLFRLVVLVLRLILCAEHRCRLICAHLVQVARFASRNRGHPAQPPGFCLPCACFRLCWPLFSSLGSVSPAIYGSSLRPLPSGSVCFASCSDFSALRFGSRPSLEPFILSSLPCATIGFADWRARKHACWEILPQSCSWKTRLLFSPCPVCSVRGCSFRGACSACSLRKNSTLPSAMRTLTVLRATMPNAFSFFSLRISFRLFVRFASWITVGRNLRSGPRTIKPLREILAARFLLPPRWFMLPAWVLARACLFCRLHFSSATAISPLAWTVCSAQTR